MSAATTARLRESDRARTMVTPEGITLPLTLSSRGSRFGALLLDLMFIFFLMLFTTLGLIWLAGGVANIEGLEAGDGRAKQAMQFLMIVWIASMFLFRNAYFLFFELGPRGATPV